MTEPNRLANAADEFRRAGECLASAEKLAESSLTADSISRSYYAMLHASRALLLTRGLEATTHKGLAFLVHREFVRPGDFPAELGSRLPQAMDLRELADYDAQTHFEEIDAREQLDLARRYVEAVHGHLRRLWPESHWP